MNAGPGARAFLRTHRKARWFAGYVVLAALVYALNALAPQVTYGLARSFGWSIVGVGQAAVVFFAVLPAAGLLWFAWHMLFHRRARLLKLRRIRYRQGRTPSLLSPPPIFGGAYERKKKPRISAD